MPCNDDRGKPRMRPDLRFYPPGLGCEVAWRSACLDDILPVVASSEQSYIALGSELVFCPMSWARASRTSFCKRKHSPRTTENAYANKCLSYARRVDERDTAAPNLLLRSETHQGCENAPTQRARHPHDVKELGELAAPTSVGRRTSAGGQRSEHKSSPRRSRGRPP